MPWLTFPSSEGEQTIYLIITHCWNCNDNIYFINIDLWLNTEMMINIGSFFFFWTIKSFRKPNKSGGNGRVIALQHLQT